MCYEQRVIQFEDKGYLVRIYYYFLFNINIILNLFLYVDEATIFNRGELVMIVIECIREIYRLYLYGLRLRKFRLKDYEFFLEFVDFSDCIEVVYVLYFVLNL